MTFPQEHSKSVTQDRSAHTVFVFCIHLRTNSDLCHLQHKLIGFYNRDGKCLLRGTDWVFKYSSLRFVFKGLTLSVNQINCEIFGAREREGGD